MVRPKVAPAFYLPEVHRKALVKFKSSQLANLKARHRWAHSPPRRLTGIGSSRPQFSTMSPDSSIEYRWIDGVERLELYEPGGYHPVVINDLLHNRYRIVDKLGFGGYSTIWLARDEIHNRYVAVKIGISSPSLPRRELEVLKALNSSGPSSQVAAVPTILDAFDVCGPNGTHPCYTVTPAQGNLKEASFSRLFPVQVARALAAKLASAVAFVHSRGFVHGGLSDQLYARLITVPNTDGPIQIFIFGTCW